MDLRELLMRGGAGLEAQPGTGRNGRDGFFIHQYDKLTKEELAYIVRFHDLAFTLVSTWAKVEAAIQDAKAARW